MLNVTALAPVTIHEAVTEHLEYVLAKVYRSVSHITVQQDVPSEEETYNSSVDALCPL